MRILVPSASIAGPVLAYWLNHYGYAVAVDLFRGNRRLDVDHRDVPRRKELLRVAFAGMHPDVDRWLDELEHATAFYLDSITQLRLDSWSRGTTSDDSVRVEEYPAAGR